MRRVAPVLLIFCASCKPDLGPSDSLVTSTRVVAVRGEPPEQQPGKTARFDLLVASPDGTLPPSPEWAMCTTPKPLGENDVVNRACVDGSGAKSAGVAPTIDAAIPDDACALFGPDPPAGGHRPRDPDSTGGYYQPVRARAPGADVAFGLERITCNLANAPADVAHEFAARYLANANPKLLPLAATIDGSPTALESIPSGARVVFEAAWTPDSAEDFAAFDAATQSIALRRESMRVSWYATAGRFEADRTGRDESDSATTTDDAWTAPGEPGVVHLWIVLRDSRGGIDFASHDLTVR